MSGIEEQFTRNAIETRLSKILEDETTSAAEKSKKIYQEISKLLIQNEESLQRQLDISSDISDVQSRYSNDRVKLLQVERDMLKSNQDQLASIEHQLNYVEEGSDQYDKLIKKQQQLLNSTAAINEAYAKEKTLASDRENILDEILTKEKARKDLAEKAIEKTKEDIKLAKSRGDDKEVARLQKNLNVLQGREQDNNLFSGGSGVTSALGGLANALKGLSDGTFGDVIRDSIDTSEMSREIANADLDDKDEKRNKQLEKLQAVVDAIGSLANAFDKFVDKASQFVIQNQGQLNAALYGTGITYEALVDQSSVLTASGILKQTDYLQSVKTLAQQGIGAGIEGGGAIAALLTAVTEKTVPQFNATNSYIRRLVLLGEKEATQKYFGLESILQGALNKQFGETSYLNQLFDSVNSNLTDAIANLADATSVSNSYAFTTTVQEWLSTLYEQGVDAATINKMSSVLNALGSGNVSAMSSDAGMQKLALLAMDRSGLDYATILQNGLSANDVDVLLASMVTYLKDVAGSTNANNVLESAYANLFGISMADMYALRNIDESKFVSLGVGKSGGEALTETQKRLQMLGTTEYTPVAAMIENVLDNISFNFGNDIASNTGKYIGWKGGKLLVNIGDAISSTGIGKFVGKGITAAGVAAMAGVGLSSAVNTILGIKDSLSEALESNSNTVLGLYNDLLGAATAASGETVEEIKTTTNKGKVYANKFGVRSSVNNSNEKEYSVTAEEIEETYNKEDDNVRILKDFEKTFMKNTEGNLAIAVSLQGMSNEVLKSFASIFADEDAMGDVFKGDAKNKLFDYNGEDKTTSSSTRKTNPQNNSTTGSGTNNK